MTDNAIEIKNVTKKLGDFKIDKLDLTLPHGCIMGLVGENGAGKSTLIRLIMNASNTDSGEISVLGTDNKSDEFVRTRAEIGIVTDQPPFYDYYNCIKIDRLMKGYYPKWDSERFFELLGHFKIDRKKKFYKLSKGMKMLVTIATALSHDARMLILDEPTSGLDPMIRDEILDMITELSRDREVSVLISSHIISDLEKVCDYVAFLHGGRLKLCEEKDRLLESYSLVKLTEDQLDELPKDSYIGVRRGKYSCEVLMENKKIPEGFAREHTTLEEIILFTARDEREEAS